MGGGVRGGAQAAGADDAAFAAAGLVEDATGRAGAASRLRVTERGEALLAEAAAKVEALDAAFEDAHPGLTEALRAHVAELMAGPR